MRTTITTAILVALVSASAAIAQPPGQRGQMRGQLQARGEAHDELIAELGLTSEQQAALKAMRDSFQTAMIDLRANVEKAKVKTRSAMADGDKDAVMSALEAESAAELELSKARAGFQFAIDDVIGPEKAAQLKELRKEKREERRAERMQHRPDRGPGFGRGPGQGAGPGGPGGPPDADR